MRYTRLRMHRRAAIAGLLGAFIALATARCERGSARVPPRPDAATRRALPGLGPVPPALQPIFGVSDDAGDPQIEPTQSTLAGPLAACVRRARESLAPELSAALGVMSYSAFAEDSCRLSFALSLRDPALCDAVQLAQLASSCRFRVAVARAERALCPRALDEPGPDPMCVALSLRKYSACPAAGGSFGDWCRAIAERDVDRCRATPGPLRPRCVSDVLALAEVIPHESRPQPAPGRMRIELSWPDGREGSTTIDADGFDRGAYVTDSRAIVLVDPRRRWPSSTAFALDGQSAAAGFELTLGEDRRGSVTRMRVVLAGGRVIESADGQSAGAVEYGHASRDIGHELSGTITARGTCAGRVAVVRATFSTFVRDVVADREAREGTTPARSRDAGLDPDEP